MLTTAHFYIFIKNLYKIEHFTKITFTLVVVMVVGKNTSNITHLPYLSTINLTQIITNYKIQIPEDLIEMQHLTKLDASLHHLEVQLCEKHLGQV